MFISIPCYFQKGPSLQHTQHTSHPHTHADNTKESQIKELEQRIKTEHRHLRQLAADIASQK